MLHLRNTSADSVVSDIPILCGVMKMPPWLNTRSTGALDAGTDSAQRAPSARLPYFECSPQNVRQEVSMSSSCDKYLPVSYTHLDAADE